MRLEQCPLPGGGSLTVYLRDAAQAMPNALRRPVPRILRIGFS